MIVNGKDTPLSKSFSTLPNVADVLPDWFQDLRFDIITKSLVNYEVEEVIVPVATYGVRQPMSAQQIAIKPEGQRAWKWETIHCLPDVPLRIDDVVVFGNQRYRVMQKWDWSEYGYQEVHICQAYQAGEES